MDIVEILRSLGAEPTPENRAFLEEQILEKMKAARAEAVAEMEESHRADEIAFRYRHGLLRERRPNG